MTIDKDEKGQALFEFIVFLPFFITMIFLLIVSGGAINGSINQQKATRGYFFFDIKGDSTIPGIKDLESSEGKGVTTQGVFSYGWAERFENNNTPIAPCYVLQSFAGKEIDDTCETAVGNEKPTNFIRVRTLIGVCTAQYYMKDGIYRKKDADSGDINISSTCILN